MLFRSLQRVREATEALADHELSDADAYDARAFAPHFAAHERLVRIMTDAVAAASTSHTPPLPRVELNLFELQLARTSQDVLMQRAIYESLVQQLAEELAKPGEHEWKGEAVRSRPQLPPPAALP